MCLDCLFETFSIFLFIFMGVALYQDDYLNFLQCTIYLALYPLLKRTAVALLLLLLQAAPFCSCSAAYCCCCCCFAAAAAVGLLPSCSFCCRLHKLLCSCCRSWAGQYSALAQAQTRNRTIGTSQPTAVPARQDLFHQAPPGQDSVAASLSIVWMLIRSLNEDLWQSGRIHPNCPCPQIAVLQPPLQGPTYIWQFDKRPKL